MRARRAIGKRGLMNSHSHPSTVRRYIFRRARSPMKPNNLLYRHTSLIVAIGPG